MWGLWMVSTYLSYNLVTRDLNASLNRVAKQTDVSREADYYKANISKVKSVDDFMNDDRLYNYAMKAYGLEDMAYAKAFMRKVLESDLSDSDSFANKLTDTRYKDFAASFNFNEEKTTAQTSKQIDDLIGIYSSTMESEEEKASTETSYFNAMMGKITNVDELLGNERLRSYVFTAFGLDDTYYSRSFLKGVLTSDTSDSSSYINQTLGSQRDQLTASNDTLQQQLDASSDPDERISIRNKMSANDKQLETIQNYYDLADTFQFNADGSVPTTGAQTADQTTDINSRFLSNQERVSQTTALNEDEHFQEKVATVTNVTDLASDSRVLSYIKTAFNLTSASWTNIKAALTSDLNDPNSTVYSLAEDDENYLALAKAFNFGTDGTVAAGSAQTASQHSTMSSLYFNRYNDTQDAADEKAESLYRTAIAGVTSVDDFMKSDNAYSFALKAVGIDPDEVSAYTMKKVLQSDLSDKKSFVYTLNDERYVTLAKAFNFGTDGKTTAPLTAQSSSTITAIASEYTVRETRFLTGSEQTKAKEDASKETEYYSEQMLSIQTASEFLSDSRLTNVVLKSYGIDPKDVTSDFLKQVFSSDLDDPKSFVNQQKDGVWAEMLGSFNFDSSGNLTRAGETGAQSRGKIIETEHKYTRLTLEEQQGEDNNGVRLALYFERMAPTINTAYDILGDTALLEFFRVSYSLPDTFSNLDVDKQAELVKKYMNLSDLEDPDKVSKMVSKFSALYDLENSDSSSSALSILTGSSTSSGISADLLYSLSQS